MDARVEPAMSLSEIVVNGHLGETYLLLFIFQPVFPGSSAGGVIANLLLLYAIGRFSRPAMGTYKYLLATFASVDVVLSALHAITRPVMMLTMAQRIVIKNGCSEI